MLPVSPSFIEGLAYYTNSASGMCLRLMSDDDAFKGERQTPIYHISHNLTRPRRRRREDE